MIGRGLGALVLVLAGCLAPDRAPRASSGAEPVADDGTSEGGDGDDPGFDPQDVLDEAFDYRNTMNQVNDAPEPATHGDAERVNYFAAPGNESLFRTIDPALTDQQVTFSEGAMFVKEHLDPDGAVIGFTVMRKARPGYDPAGNEEGLALTGMKLGQDVTVPVRLKPSTYIDPPTLERLRAAGLEAVSVKIPLSFEWARWEQRWAFLVGVGLTLLGVLLKRSKASQEEVEQRAQEVESLGADLREIEASVAQVQVGLQHLDVEALHELVDPLLSGPAYRFAEGREAIRTAHGTRTYLAVMDPFARAERRLNRAWSAAVDGYASEARASLQAALEPLREAREALPGVSAPPEPRSALADESGELIQPPDVPGAP